MPLDNARIRALLFDVDGTLSDTDDKYVERVRRFLPSRLFPNRDRAARRIVMGLESPANGLMSLADRMGFDDHIIRVIDWLSRQRPNPGGRFLLVPGVDAMLERLHGRYAMAVVSTRAESSTIGFLEQFDLERYFRAVVAGRSTPHTKPYPDPALLAAQWLGVPPQSCVMIGDTTVDIRSGRAAGMQTVGVLCGFGEEAELRRAGADAILGSTRELADLLFGTPAESHAIK